MQRREREEKRRAANDRLVMMNREGRSHNVAPAVYSQCISLQRASSVLAITKTTSFWKETNCFWRIVSDNCSIELQFSFLQTRMPCVQHILTNPGQYTVVKRQLLVLDR